VQEFGVEMVRLTGPLANLGLKSSHLFTGYQALLVAVQGSFLNFISLG
jgi:hypothetical protein